MWPFGKTRSAADEEVPEFCHFLGDPDAERLRFVLRKRDWDTAREILSAADPEHRSYLVRVAAGTVGIEKWISGPIREEPDSVLPLLVKAVHMVSWSWELPGAATDGSATDEDRAALARHLEKAEQLLDEVLERTPRDADAWVYKLEAGRARHLPLVERWRRFERLIEIDPTHWFGHEEMLWCLRPDWGGNTPAMFDFARTRALACPGTHVPTLVVLAHRAHTWHLAKARKPVDRDRTLDLTYYESVKVMDEIWEASQLSVWHDDYRETLLTPIAWNNFAFALTYGDFHQSAWSLYEAIGEDWITEHPWDDIEFFQKSRAYTQDNLD
ncbi:hypothetical protein [Actinoplanes sichuanensis]|uniref:DUF4034 domain-containing protein n=1 Tax=Actinoplanes sichuanensis TaxID=512349 RepID=A0ABW4AEN3_9ACTN|nr:hypothetical protein [Actinoplanes sichuanensis]